MSKVNFVYFAGNTNWTLNFWATYNGYNKPFDRRCIDNYNYWRKANSTPYPAGDKFYLNCVKPDEHYFYIITPAYLEIFEEEMKRLDMWQYKIYESKEFAENHNYPGEARLKVFIFHTPKDFVHKPIGETNV